MQGDIYTSEMINAHDADTHDLVYVHGFVWLDVDLCVRIDDIVALYEQTHDMHDDETDMTTHNVVHVRLRNGTTYMVDAGISAVARRIGDAQSK